ncbi:penicillin acylase family protein [Pseudoalteromonas byunsanensis]|uniref:Penicillin acylase family protein n=1 Tax=Pseudoalteromonas byunsanensis TaxID=327939 RepID=A0A1S1NE30_9GAMM|nr:penicillin acylase family protein [Pseudoalteromonas byunsanensis]OHU97990.1 penicillin acylase family protein [Pseudoalteromonas byunsanensis]
MLKILKWLLMLLVIVGLAVTAMVYGLLSLSLPTLDGKQSSHAISADVKVSRDNLGQAVIKAQNRQDAAYGLGFAHGQDRFFQMDLLRRNAAGELSELFGEAALNLDKQMRFHQFRERSEQIYAQLSQSHQDVLTAYTQGVNDGQRQAGFNTFEYYLTGAQVRAWQPADSILVIFAMYLDLQAGNYERDEALIQMDSLFGPDMIAFLTQPSRYQAALDGSKLPVGSVPIPLLEVKEASVVARHIESLPHYGSNNWAVTGALTETNKAMMSDDMHLGLNVPVIWYRAQLNYQFEEQQIQVTGVSLPGAPAIVVGTNNKVAWGFTNGYLDLADWVELDEQTNTWTEFEKIALPNGELHQYELTMSEFGPVKAFNDKQYALSWVAHQPYAVNLNLLEFERAGNVNEAMSLAPDVGIPVQNLMVVDYLGHIGWQPMGAIPKRTEPVDLAVLAADFPTGWQQNESQRPRVVNPPEGRLWSANSRVMSVADHLRFGDGGYALGARAQQIRDRLMSKPQFNERDFNQLQQDNEALFLKPWHERLTQLLSVSEQSKLQYATDLKHLAAWQACACAESVGYTLVKHFRAAVIDVALAPIEEKLRARGSSLSSLKNYLEPALWQLITEQPDSWLNGHKDWYALQLAAYERAKDALTVSYGSQMEAWRWGNVNALNIRHPFSQQLPILSGLLDMPRMPAFGDTFMPAVQGSSFGASQRFIAQPGALDKAIMTIAGGQSGHPLSVFYRAGFEAYANGEATPLLPSESIHQLTIQALR